MWIVGTVLLSCTSSACFCSFPCPPPQPLSLGSPGQEHLSQPLPTTNQHTWKGRSRRPSAATTSLTRSGLCQGWNFVLLWWQSSRCLPCSCFGFSPDPGRFSAFFICLFFYFGVVASGLFCQVLINSLLLTCGPSASCIWESSFWLDCYSSKHFQEALIRKKKIIDLLNESLCLSVCLSVLVCLATYWPKSSFYEHL